MTCLRYRVYSSIAVLAVLGLPAFASAGFTVESVDGGRVVLSDAGKVAPGSVFEVKQGDDLLGFLSARDDPDEVVRVELIAGRAEPGAEVIPIERPATRVGFLGREEGERVKDELGVLCPDRVVDLEGEGDLDPEKLDAAVITSGVSEQAVRRLPVAARAGSVLLRVRIGLARTSPASPGEVRV